MEFTINGHKLTTGAISNGTLKTSDLIKTYSDEIRRLSATPPKILFEAECWLKGPREYADNDFTEAFPNDPIEDTHETLGPSVLTDLDEHLNRMAPAGIFFGDTPGDGACFGWWENEE